MEAFSREFPEANIIGLDIPGTGELHLVKSYKSIKKNVTHLRDRFIKLVGKPKSDGHDGPQNYIIGISLGGMLAIEWMQQYPQDFKKAILINTSMSGVSPLYHRMHLSAFMQLMFMPLLPKESYRQGLIYNLTSNLGLAQKKAVVAYWETLAKSAPVSTSNALRQLWSAMTFWPNKNKPEVPIQLFSSVNDHIVGHQCSQRIADLWKVPILKHETAGHDLLLDDPNWAALKAKEFFLP
jgi:alpha-beta hydrolase superfamily lysophospholipase